PHYFVLMRHPPRPPRVPSAPLFRSIGSAVRAEGGREGDPALAETWWKRRHSAEPWPGPPPTLQVTATPSKLRGAYHAARGAVLRSEAHTSELQSRENLVCRLVLENI